jgi:hypothetical protein
LALPRLRLSYRLRIRAWASASSCPRIPGAVNGGRSR